jgi:hypothetical protein
MIDSEEEIRSEQAYRAFEQALADNWVAKLTSSELKLLTWVAKQNLRLGKPSSHFHTGNITAGYRDRESGVVLVEGSGISERTLKRAIAKLKRRGILTANFSGKGTWRAGYWMEIHTDVRL